MTARLLSDRGKRCRNSCGKTSPGRKWTRRTPEDSATPQPRRTVRRATWSYMRDSRHSRSAKGFSLSIRDHGPTQRLHFPPQRLRPSVSNTRFVGSPSPVSRTFVPESLTWRITDHFASAVTVQTRHRPAADLPASTHLFPRRPTRRRRYALAGMEVILRGSRHESLIPLWRRRIRTVRGYISRAQSLPSRKARQRLLVYLPI